MSAASARRPATAEDLLDAGIDLFGRHGYDGVSTRDLARAAGANVSAIRYHFGGKDELYVACLDHIVGLVGDRMRLAQDLAGHARALADDDPARRARLVEQLVETLLDGFLGHPRIRRVLPMVLRELILPGPHFERVYAAVPGPLHETLTALVAWIDGTEPDAPATIVRTHALLGALVMFHVGRPILLRRLGAGAAQDPGALVDEYTDAHRTLIVGEVQRVVLSALGLAGHRRKQAA